MVVATLVLTHPIPFWSTFRGRFIAGGMSEESARSRISDLPRGHSRSMSTRADAHPSTTGRPTGRLPSLPSSSVHRTGGLAARPRSCGTMPGRRQRMESRTAQGREPMGCYVLGFQDIDQTQIELVGGKGAHLGELSRVEGIRVPAGFCVTTDAFRRILAEAPSIDDRLDRLSRLKPDDREAIRALSAEIRRTLEGIAIPDDLAAAITRPLARLGEQAAYAVRSSATAEDLPTASSAAHRATYLTVVGRRRSSSTSAGAGPRSSPSGP